MRGPRVRPIVIAAGGTGGHFFPAEALASELIRRGHRIVLMTDQRTGTRLGPVFAGGEHHILSGAGMAGRGFARGFGAALSLASGVMQARRLFAQLDAAAIVAFGGYPSIPPVLGAGLLRKRLPVVLHEQNAVLGRANRFLARRAEILALGFANTTRLPRPADSRFIGNPVRPAIQLLAGKGYAPPEGAINLLVLGGSLGARVLSDIVPGAISGLPESVRSRLRIVQQCRVDDISRVRAAYRVCRCEAELAPFFTDVAERLAVAHLVISRAGASTCAEIAVAGRPAILVPLPGAIDDHQTANARAVTGATVIDQSTLSPELLGGCLSRMLQDPHSLAAAARQIALCGRPDAASDLASIVESLMTKVEIAP